MQLVRCRIHLQTASKALVWTMKPQSLAGKGYMQWSSASPCGKCNTYPCSVQTNVTVCLILLWVRVQNRHFNYSCMRFGCLLQLLFLHGPPLGSTQHLPIPGSDLQLQIRVHTTSVEIFALAAGRVARKLLNTLLTFRMSCVVSIIRSPCCGSIGKAKEISRSNCSLTSSHHSSYLQITQSHYHAHITSNVLCRKRC